MVRWPEPNRPGFVAFHHDYRDDSRGDPEDEAYFALPKVEEYMRAILTSPRNYFGVVDQFGCTLQFMGNEDGSVRVEFPDTARQGSMTRDASLDECVAWILAAGPSLRELSIPGLVFEPW